jgi:hypothetical protein
MTPRTPILEIFVGPEGLSFARHGSTFDCEMSINELSERLREEVVDVLAGAVTFGTNRENETQT